MANKNAKAKEDKKNIIIGLIACLIIGALIVFFIFRDKPKDSEAMSIYEAQTKCTLMEEADLVNLNGEPFDETTTAKADKTCRESWDRTKDPDNTDEKFIEAIKADWEERKSEVLEGYTLEEYYNESIK